MTAVDYFHLAGTPAQLATISNLGLAHLGDGVYELMVRSYVILKGKATNKGLHRATVGYVAAPAQAKAAKAIVDKLSPEEREVFHRGRNASPHTIPQNASREEYQTATGLETLFGWLYFQGRTERLCELFETMMEETVWH